MMRNYGFRVVSAAPVERHYRVIPMEASGCQRTYGALHLTLLSLQSTPSGSGDDQLLEHTTDILTADDPAGGHGQVRLVRDKISGGQSVIDFSRGQGLKSCLSKALSPLGI